MASIKQLSERKYKITISNGYRTDGRKICKAKTIHVPDSVPKRGVEQYVYHEAERLERLFKQGYSEDGEMTFETYARGWLERQTKYAPYDRLLPTFARNRVPGVGGMGSYFYHSSFNASATSCAMRCLSSSLFACAYRSSAASRRAAA